LCLAGHPALADDAAVGPAGQKFSQLFEQWEGYFSEIDAMQKKYQTASAEEKPAIEQKYAEVVAQIDKLGPVMAEAARAAYVEAPNADENATKMVVGMAQGACQRDKYEEAKELVALLEQNNCQDPKLDDIAGIAAFCTHDFVAAAKYFRKARAAGTISPLGQKYLASCPDYEEFWKKEQEIRAREAAADDLPRVKLATTKGDIVLELFENEAPQTVGNFVNLVERGFYDGLIFHRVLPNFMAQGGCPDGTGGGGPGYKIFCECSRPDHRNHFSGSLSMAHAGPNTGGSQFFLTFVPTAHLNGKHTVFGRVIEGMDVLSELQRIDPQGGPGQPEPDKIVKATVLRKRDHEYAPTKVP
jgi:cyclophilin family peptidyl-prolyl cis-trans isomerase